MVDILGIAAEGAWYYGEEGEYVWTVEDGMLAVFLTEPEFKTCENPWCSEDALDWKCPACGASAWVDEG